MSKKVKLGFDEFKPRKVIATKYATKMVDNRYYSTIKFSGDTNQLPHQLTEEEFRAGKQGITWMDNLTGKILFKGEKSLTEILKLEPTVIAPPTNEALEIACAIENERARQPKCITVVCGIEAAEELKKH